MFRTGDYGRIINNMVYYEGRADSQVKIRGHRVDLNEVNGIIYRLNDLVAACVVLCYKPGEPDQVNLLRLFRKHYHPRISTNRKW